MKTAVVTRCRSSCRSGSGPRPPPTSRWRTSIARAIAGACAPCWPGLAAAGVVVALVLGLVGLRMQQVRLSYRLDTLRTAKAGAEEMNRRLRVEKASLQSLARIEVEARARLGMVAPTQQQVQLAREFAGDGTASTARHERTAAAVEPAREPGSASMKRGEAAPPP